MLPVQKLRQVSKLFLISGIIIVPISILELYYGQLYNSSILLADSFHGFIDATSVILFSILLNIIYKRSKKFPWGLYNLESISILFVTIFIVYLAISYLTTEIRDVNIKQPTWLSIIVYISSIIFLIVYSIERRYSWISLVKSDLTHAKLDISMEIFSGTTIIVNNYYLTLIVIISMIGFILFDAIRQFKEAIYSLIGVNYNSPIKERIKIILESLGFDIKSIYLRKIGSFYTLYVIIGSDPSLTLGEIYKMRKIVKRIGGSFDGIVNVEVKVVPEKSKKPKTIKNINVLKASLSNKVNEKNRAEYPSLVKNIADSRRDSEKSNIRH